MLGEVDQDRYSTGSEYSDTSNERRRKKNKEIEQHRKKYAILNCSPDEFGEEEDRYVHLTSDDVVPEPKGGVEMNENERDWSSARQRTRRLWLHWSHERRKAYMDAVDNLNWDNRGRAWYDNWEKVLDECIRGKGYESDYESVVTEREPLVENQDDPEPEGLVKYVVPPCMWSKKVNGPPLEAKKRFKAQDTRCHRFIFVDWLTGYTRQECETELVEYLPLLFGKRWPIVTGKQI